MRTLRFHKYGEPADVLQLESAPVPAPAPSRVRVAVHACGLNPAIFDRANHQIGFAPHNPCP